MSHQNPLHEAIYTKIVKPAIDSKTFSSNGIIAAHDESKGLVDVMWEQGEGPVISEKIPLPLYGEGLFGKSPEVGDLVKIEFENGDIRRPYVSIIYKKSTFTNELYAPYGAGIPEDIG